MEPSNGEKKAGRGANGRFEKGYKGGGRKEIPKDIKDMLRGATPDACKLLCNTINDEKAKLELRIKCSEIVLDRVYGKPIQKQENTNLNVNAEPTVSLEESLKIIKELTSDG